MSTQFKRGDYIVCLKLSNDAWYNVTTRENFCTKQSFDDEALNVEKDIAGTPNGYSRLRFDKTDLLQDWRYATQEEIDEYNRLGHPFDVTTLWKLPEKWAIKRDDQNFILVNKWCNSPTNHRNEAPYVASTGWIHSTSDPNRFGFKKKPGYTEITFEQFKKYVLNMKEREIIGYKLIKPEYEKAAAEICGLPHTNFKPHYNNCSFEPNSICACTLEKAGVLNLWFAPVYKNDKQVFKVGDFEITTENGKAYHKSDDITDFVIGLVETFDKSYKFGGFVAEIDGIVFNRTGCQHSHSTLEEWKKVYKAL